MSVSASTAPLDIGGNDRQPDCHRLQHREGQALEVRWQSEHIEGRKEPRHAPSMPGAAEPDRVEAHRQAAWSHPLAHPRRVWPRGDSGPSFAASAAPRINTSCRFWRARRPAVPTMNASDGRPSSSRASARLSGRSKRSIGRPGAMTRRDRGRWSSEGSVPAPPPDCHRCAMSCALRSDSTIQASTRGAAQSLRVRPRRENRTSSAGLCAVTTTGVRRRSVPAAMPGRNSWLICTMSGFAVLSALRRRRVCRSSIS